VTANIAIGELFSGYCEQIERLIGEANYVDAFSNLQDFIRDFCPGKKRNALTLCSRYHRWREAQSLGLNETDNINVIVHACLDLVDDVRRTFSTDDTKSPPTSVAPPPQVAEMPEPLAAVAMPLVTPPSSVPAVPQSEATDSTITLDEARRQYFSNLRRNQSAPAKFVVFQCRDLVRGYQRSRFKLGEISLELRAGEITAVVGRNASGKTTFLRMVAGELLPDSGHISYPMLTTASAMPDWLDIRGKIAFVPQLPERWHGRLRHNLNYVAATFGAKGEANRELVDWHVTRYGLRDYENAVWDEISGGYKIRFELVRALVSQPNLLILDEPLAYLDIVTRQRLLADLRSIASSLETPMPILITSQHVYEIEAIADQIIILDDGKCAFCGYLDEIPKDGPRTLIEISLRVKKAELIKALAEFDLKGVEETIEGYILALPAGIKIELLFLALRKRFGDDFYAFRDITRSTRSLMSEIPNLADVLAMPQRPDTGATDDPKIS
jgi:ABC-2 type transport system ATP-binding protein